MDQTGYLVLLAVLATAFGALGGFVAVQKGRSAGEGVALGGLFGPLGVLVEALLPSVATAPRSTVGADPRAPAPGPVRPRRSLRAGDVEVTEPGDPPGWQRYRREPTGETFWAPAPEPEPEPPPQPGAGPKRWERPLRRVEEGE